MSPKQRQALLVKAATWKLEGRDWGADYILGVLERDGRALIYDGTVAKLMHDLEPAR